MTLDLATLPLEAPELVRGMGAVGDGGYGVPIASGHDVDGDGHMDYLLGALTGDRFGRTDCGQVTLMLGDSQFGRVFDTSISNPDTLDIIGAQARENLGGEVWIGDVTGDGLGDLIICRQNYRPDPSRTGAGALTIVPGSPNLRALAESQDYVDMAAAPASLNATTILGEKLGDRLGIWARTGDVDGDGIEDIIVAADQYDLNGENNRGRVYILRGGPHFATGQTLDLAAPNTGSLAGNLAIIDPPAGSTNYHLGATCILRDMDGNGRAEALIAATLNRAGAALQPYDALGMPTSLAFATGGSPQGTLFIAWDDHFPAAPWPEEGLLLTLDGEDGTLTVLNGHATFNISFGEEIVAGDFDGDGKMDVLAGDLVGSRISGITRNIAGTGWLVYGIEDYKNRTVNMNSRPAGMRLTQIIGPVVGAIGADTAMDGDFDGDGIDDLAFGNPHDNPLGRFHAGTIHVFYGQAGGWPAIIDLAPGNLPDPSVMRIALVQGARGGVSGDRGDTLCYSIGRGDIDGDGRDDIVTNEMLGNGLHLGLTDVGNLLIIDGAALLDPPNTAARGRAFE